MLRPALSLGLALGALACTPTVSGEARPALARLDAPLRRIAVLPLGVGPLLRTAQSAESSPAAAAQLVSRYLAEALAARGVEVIGPEDAARALAGADPARRPPELLAREHGADGVLRGELTRWEEREGEAYGTFAAAAVGFRVALAAAPGGGTLWTGEFDERQQPLGENVLRAGRYPGGGTRWLSAAELARWGAQEIARALPLGGRP